MAEVDQIFIISVDPHVGVRPPGLLDLLCSHLVFGLELNFLLPLQVSPPGPLDLDGGDMVHGEPVVLEQSTRQ